MLFVDKGLKSKFRNRKRKITSKNTEFDIRCQNKQQKHENKRASLFIKFVVVFQNILHELYTII